MEELKREPKFETVFEEEPSTKALSKVHGTENGDEANIQYVDTGGNIEDEGSETIKKCDSKEKDEDQVVDGDYRRKGESTVEAEAAIALAEEDTVPNPVVGPFQVMDSVDDVNVIGVENLSYMRRERMEQVEGIKTVPASAQQVFDEMPQKVLRSPARQVLDEVPVRSWSTNIATVGHPKACMVDLIGIDNLHQSKGLEAGPEEMA
ncbi:hypothetical protein U1Q18_025659 [Sarracenia purpurea var. burkii]